MDLNSLPTSSDAPVALKELPPAVGQPIPTDMKTLLAGLAFHQAEERNVHRQRIRGKLLKKGIQKRIDQPEASSSAHSSFRVDTEVPEESIPEVIMPELIQDNVLKRQCHMDCERETWLMGLADLSSRQAEAEYNMRLQSEHMAMQEADSYSRNMRPLFADRDRELLRRTIQLEIEIRKQVELQEREARRVAAEARRAAAVERIRQQEARAREEAEAKQRELEVELIFIERNRQKMEEEDHLSSLTEQAYRDAEEAAKLVAQEMERVRLWEEEQRRRDEAEEKLRAQRIAELVEKRAKLEALREKQKLASAQMTVDGVKLQAVGEKLAKQRRVQSKARFVSKKTSAAVDPPAPNDVTTNFPLELDPSKSNPVNVTILDLSTVVLDEEMKAWKSHTESITTESELQKMLSDVFEDRRSLRMEHLQKREESSEDCVEKHKSSLEKTTIKEAILKQQLEKHRKGSLTSPQDPTSTDTTVSLDGEASPKTNGVQSLYGKIELIFREAESIIQLPVHNVSSQLSAEERQHRLLSIVADLSQCSIELTNTDDALGYLPKVESTLNMARNALTVVVAPPKKPPLPSTPPPLELQLAAKEARSSISSIDGNTLAQVPSTFENKPILVDNMTEINATNVPEASTEQTLLDVPEVSKEVNEEELQVNMSVVTKGTGKTSPRFWPFRKSPRIAPVDESAKVVPVGEVPSVTSSHPATQEAMDAIESQAQALAKVTEDTSSLTSVEDSSSIDLSPTSLEIPDPTPHMPNDRSNAFKEASDQPKEVSDEPSGVSDDVNERTEEEILSLAIEKEVERLVIDPTTLPGWKECIETSMYSAAHHAAFFGYSEVLLFLCRYFDCFLQDKHGRSPLFYASLGNRVECLATLLEIGPQWIDVGDLKGDTALHAAAINDSIDTLSFLLSCEAHPDTANNSGLTPSHLAKSPIALQILSSLNAQLYCIDSRSRMPLVYAAAEGRLACLQFLCQVTPSHFLQWPDNDGDTALHRAASKGHTDCVAVLCHALYSSGYHSHIDIANSRGHTAAHVASNVATLRVLYEYGTNLWQLDTKNHAPLFLASFFGRTEIVAFLLDDAYRRQSFDTVQLRDIQGDTALHAACLRGSFACVSLLQFFVRDSRNNRNLLSSEIAERAGFHSLAKTIQSLEDELNKSRKTSPTSPDYEIVAKICDTDWPTFCSVLSYYGGRWQKAYSAEHDSPYYVDRLTGASQWDVPLTCDLPPSTERTYDAILKLLCDFFKRYNPEKLSAIDTILTSYTGRYTTLCVELAKKYRRRLSPEDLSKLLSFREEETK